jgi:hypothetical protein
MLYQHLKVIMAKEDYLTGQSIATKIQIKLEIIDVYDLSFDD